MCPHEKTSLVMEHGVQEARWARMPALLGAAAVAASDRVRRMLDRVIRRHSTRVIVRPVRYASFSGMVVGKARRRSDRNRSNSTKLVFAGPARDIMSRRSL
jgi:hypothetical protein